MPSTLWNVAGGIISLYFFFFFLIASGEEARSEQTKHGLSNQRTKWHKVTEMLFLCALNEKGKTGGARFLEKLDVKIVSTKSVIF